MSAWLPDRPPPARPVPGPVRHWPGWAAETETRLATEVRRAAYEVIQRKGATNHAIGLVTASLLRCMLRGEKRVLTVSRVQEGAAGLHGVALVSRVTRAAMLDVGRKDFVLMLHAKGLSHRRIQLQHVLRHALLPVVTILSLRIGWIVGGAVTIEFVFARPGLGSLLITSLSQRDYPVVQGCLLMLAMAVMLGTLLGDVVQAAMDPRVRDSLR